MKDKEIFLEETDFSARFGKKLTIERIFLEYDCLPLLCVCKDGNADESYISHVDAGSVVDGYVGCGKAPLCLSGIKMEG